MADKRRLSEQKITVRVPTALVAGLDAAARRVGVRRSEFVRRTLVDRISGSPGTGATASLYDVLLSAGVLGRFTGPTDLSTRDSGYIGERMRERAVRDSLSGRAQAT